MARHSGLQVEKSYKFQPKAYPGYKHARTLGIVKSRNGEEGGWRGEERSSRSYIFVKKGEATPPGPGSKGKTKEDDSSEGEDDNIGSFEMENVDIPEELDTWDGFGDSDKSATEEDSDHD